MTAYMHCASCYLVLHVLSDAESRHLRAAEQRCALLFVAICAAGIENTASRTDMDSELYNCFDDLGTANMLVSSNPNENPKATFHSIKRSTCTLARTAKRIGPWSREVIILLIHAS